MSDGLQFDEETARKVEALYLTPEAVAQRARVLGALKLRQGERVLDIGSGPGLLANEMAALVARNGRVCGIDISEDMLVMAKKRCADQPWTEFKKSDATHLPYPDDSFDAAVSTQVYEYVADIPQALAELYRVTRPRGRVVVLDSDYGSLVIHTENEARMERVLGAWNEHFVHAGLPRTLSRHLRDAGFTVRERDAIPMFNPEYRENTFAKGALDLMANFAAGRRGVSREEAEEWLAEFVELDKEGKFFFNLNRFLFVADKAAITD
jgi:arsenite methyltransferase